VCKELNFATKEELFSEIGIGNQLVPLIARRLLGQLPNAEGVNLSLAINGTEGVVISYAKCCHPIPGDAIVGFFNAGRGIMIHRENCSSIADLRHSPEKYVFVSWADNVSGTFQVELRLETLNKREILAIIASALSDCNANIKNIHIDNEYRKRSVLLFVIQVVNRAHLVKIIKRLRMINMVTKVVRVK